MATTPPLGHVPQNAAHAPPPQSSVHALEQSSTSLAAIAVGTPLVTTTKMVTMSKRNRAGTTDFYPMPEFVAIASTTSTR